MFNRDTFEFGERVGAAMLQDVHLQANIVLALRRAEMMQTLDDKLRAIDYVNDPQFAVQAKVELDEMADIWASQKNQNRQALQTAINVRLGPDALDLAPDLLDQVIDIEIDLQWKKLIEEMVTHAEEVLKLRIQWNAAGKN